MNKVYTHFKCPLSPSTCKKCSQLNLVTEECHTQKSTVPSDWCFVSCGGEFVLAALEWGTDNECFLSTWSAARIRERGSLPVSSSLFPPSFTIFPLLSTVKRNWAISKKQPQQCPAGAELKHGQEPEPPRTRWFTALLQQKMLGTSPGSAADCPATW